MERYLSVKEAARLYSVSTQTIYNWVERGLVENIRLGRTVRIKAPNEQSPSEPRNAKREALMDLFSGVDSPEDAALLMAKLEAVMKELERAREERKGLRLRIQELESRLPQA